jgi:hypothetical protein
VADLPLDHSLGELAALAGGRPAQDLDAVADGSQRVAQLVREESEELVLALVGVAQGLLGAMALIDFGRQCVVG